MSSRTSAAALRGLELAESVVISTRAQKPRVNTRLGNVYRSGLPAGSDLPVPDFDVLQEANASLLERWTDNVREKDQDHRHNLVTLERMRSDRSTLIGELQDQHRGLRQAFTGTYGKESLPLVGLDAPPQTRMVAVREQMLELLERLREPRLASQLPAPQNGLPALDLEALASAIETRILDLEALLVEIKRMRKETDASLVAKNQALAVHRRIYLNVTRVQESLYRLVGFDDLARRIRTAFRPTRKRKPKASAEAPETQTEDPASETGSEVESPAEPAAAPSPAGKPFSIAA